MQDEIMVFTIVFFINLLSYHISIRHIYQHIHIIHIVPMHLYGKTLNNKTWF